VQFIAKPAADNAAAKANYVFIPTAALRDKDGSKFVLLAFNGKALRRSVHVEGERSGGYLVDSLVGGESVITAGPADLQDGQKIRIKGQS
jgi:hypothetical protein